MSYQKLPVKFIGGSYKSRSRPLSVQSTVNLYPEYNPTGRSDGALQNWPGSERIVTSVAVGADRGSHDFNGVLYKVTGTKLYRVNSVLAETEIGTIAGSARCIFADNGSNMVIVNQGTAYSYNGVTLSQITDADLESPDSVAVLNNQFIYDGDGGRWVVSSPGIPGDIPDVNYASAESNGDDLVRVYVFNQVLYLFGTKTVEPWVNVETTDPPPFVRVDGGIIEDLGLYALHSVANTNQYMYFMASNRNVYRVINYQAENITTPALSYQFSQMTLTDAIGMTLNIDSQDLYVINFPTDDITYVFSEQLNLWFQIAYGADIGRHLMNSYHLIYNKHVITDYRNGNVLELKQNVYEDDSGVQIRQRDSVPINGVSLNKPGQRLIMSSFELIMETGVGLATGQGSDPEIKIGTSIDGGRTFDYNGNPYVSIGASGDYILVVRLDKVISFYDLVIRVVVSDPVFISIHAANIEIDIAGY